MVIDSFETHYIPETKKYVIYFFNNRKYQNGFALITKRLYKKLNEGENKMKYTKAQMIKDLDKINKDIATALEHIKGYIGEKYFKEK